MRSRKAQKVGREGEKKTVESKGTKRRRSRNLPVPGRIVICVAILVVLVAGILPALGQNLSQASPLVKQAQPQQPYLPRGPIFINGDAGFVQNSAVTGGMGSTSDPYIISGWSINLTLYTMGQGILIPPAGIVIENTVKNFVVRNVEVFDGVTASSAGQFHGIFLSNVQNGVVRDSLFTHDLFGVDMYNCRNDLLTGNQLVADANGFSVTSSLYNTFSYNIVYTPAGNYFYSPLIGFTLKDSSYNTLVYNNVSGSPTDGFLLQSVSAPTTANYLANNRATYIGDYGFQVQGASGNTLVSNVAGPSNGEGFFVGQADNEVLTGNYAYNNQLAGLRVEQSNHDTISSNIATGSVGTLNLTPDQVLSWGAGIGLFSSSGSTVTSNRVYNSVAGIALSLTDHTRFSDNISHNNNYGFTIFDKSNFDLFTHNQVYGSPGGGFYFDIFNSASGSDTFVANMVHHNHIGFYVTDLYPSATEPPTNNTFLENLVFSNNLPGSTILPVSPNNDGIFIAGSLGSNVTSNLIFNNPIGLEWGQTLPNGRNFVYNNFFSNPTNVLDPSQNVGGSTPNNFPRNLYNVTSRSATNIISGNSIGGNFWSDYSLSYLNGLGTNIPYMPGLDRSFCSFGGFCLYQGGDYLPLTFQPPTGTAPDINGAILTPLPLVVQQGTSGVLVNAIISRNGFAGTVTLSAAVSPAITDAPIASFSPSALTLTAGGTVASILNVTNTAAPGTYSVTITVQGPTTHTKTILLVITPNSLLSVIRGSDNGVYMSNLIGGSWQRWQFLSGWTNSTPAICDSSADRTDVVVMGTDNGIYHMAITNGVVGSWESLRGSTPERPSCAVLGGLLYVLVRGTDNAIWVTSMPLATGQWARWISLGGGTLSTPTIVARPASNRLDLIIRGTDNGVWHTTIIGDVWSGAWDTSGGGTLFTPAAVGDGAMIHVVMTGTDNGVWYSALNTTSGSWSKWIVLSGYSLAAPALTVDPAGNLNVVVRGTDSSIWHTFKPSGGSWSRWDTAGGQTMHSPATVELGSELVVLVMGTDNGVWVNAFASQWQGWKVLGGTSSSAPTLSGVT